MSDKPEYVMLACPTCGISAEVLKGSRAWCPNVHPPYDKVRRYRVEMVPVVKAVAR